MSTPLNPDALAQAKAAGVDCRINGGSTEDVAECAVEAYLAVAQPVDMPGTYTMGTEEEALKSHERREVMKAQPVVNSVEWTLNGLRAHFEWGGQIHNDPAEFDRVINQVRAQALIDLADQMRDKFTASWIRRKAREYPHGPHKPVGAFAIPEEKSNGDQDL